MRSRLFENEEPGVNSVDEEIGPRECRKTEKKRDPNVEEAFIFYQDGHVEAERSKDTQERVGGGSLDIRVQAVL